MGERYDMNYVYYQSDINWHGAARYYEYPCVFLWNLIQGYLGVGVSLKADLRIAPMLTEPGKVRLDSSGVEYEKGDGFLRVKNLGNAGRSFLLCLDGEEKQVEINGQEEYLWQKQTDK